MDWTVLGDRNSSFFHAKVNVKAKKNRIEGLFLENGVWCSDHITLKNEASSFFQQIYTCDQTVRGYFHVYGQYNPLSAEQIVMLSRNVTVQEIKDALFDMAPLKAPGVDGVTASFYKKNWDVVGTSICCMVREVFQTGVVKGDINRSLITLIPKIEKPEFFTHFRPISLCTVNYKIISKVIINWLKQVLLSLINPAQSSFVAVRHITDNIIIAQELIHSMRSCKGKKGWLAIKIDLEKAYDRLSWNFIKDSLDDAKIPAILSNVIMSGLTSSSLQVSWNGDLSRPFSPSRGVRQGDPISPYVFVVCMERLSQAIDRAVHSGEWISPSFGNNVNISHLFFADDLILFAEASIKQVEVIANILNMFCASSGHKISKEKSQVFFSPNVDRDLSLNLSNRLGFTKTDDLGKYLGVLLIHKRITKGIYSKILEKVSNRTKKWNPHRVSLASRSTLCKSTISSIPYYTMQTTAIPRTICDEMDKVNRRFLWGSSNGNTKPSLVAWSNVCQPKNRGGLGVREMRKMNDAFIMKLAYGLLLNNDSLWVKILRAKYNFSMDEIPNNLVVSKGSHLWRNIGKIWELTLRDLSWAIGNGKRAKFWKDRWTGLNRPLCELTVQEVPADLLEAKVVEYTTDDDNWKWLDITPFLPTPVLLVLAATPTPKEEFGDDAIYWRRTSSGQFSVATAYESICDDRWNCHDQKWRTVWQWEGPERIRSFLWLVLHNSLLTNDERARRHMASHTCCEVCGAENESINHVLRECSRASLIWCKFLASSEVASFFLCPFNDWFMNNLRKNDLFMGVRWSIFFGTTCWMLWNCRNKEVLGGEEINDFHIASSILAKAREFQFAYDSLSNRSTLKSSRTECFITWISPWGKFIKINTDGAFKQTTSLASAGGLIRNSNGDWCKGFMVNLGSCSSFTAELWGAFFGLSLAWNSGYRQVILEMDNKAVVDILCCRKYKVNGNWNLVQRIFQLLRKQWQVVIKHTYREGNRAADWLANHALSFPVGIQFLEQIPSGLHTVLQEDLIGVALPRMCAS